MHLPIEPVIYIWLKEDKIVRKVYPLLINLTENDTTSTLISLKIQPQKHIIITKESETLSVTVCPEDK